MTNKFTTQDAIAQAGGVIHPDFVGAQGFLLKTGVDTYVSIKTNQTASDPTVTDDVGAGYSFFSRWLNTTSNEEFVCVNPAGGAAQWRTTTSIINDASINTTELWSSSKIQSELDVTRPALIRGYLGTRTVVEIDAITSSAIGDSLVVSTGGTPSAGVSSLLVAGDITEWDGASWIKILSAVGGFPPLDTRLLVHNNSDTLFAPLVDGVDNTKFAQWDGTSFSPALSTPIDGNLVVLSGNGSVHENQVLIYDGVVPVGNWVQPRVIPIERVRTVGLTINSNVDFQSVKTAVDYAVAKGASSATPWLIQVYPGEYVEPQFTVPPGVVVSTVNGERHALTTITPANPLDDLVLLTGGHIVGLNVAGVSGVGKACIKCETASVPSFITNCHWTDCSIGVLITGAGVSVQMKRGSTGVTIAAASIETSIKVEAGGSLVLDQFTASVTAAAASLYGGLNAIDKVIWVTGVGSIASLVAMEIGVVSNDGAGVSVLADDGALVSLAASHLSGNDIATMIGSTGAATNVTVQGCSYDTNTTDFQVDSATGVMLVQADVEVINHILTAGADFNGVIFERDNHRVVLVGDVDYEFLSHRALKLNTALYSIRSSGITSGGLVTDQGGLTCGIKFGAGTVVRDGTDLDTTTVSWITAAGVVLLANSANYVIYNGETLALEVLASPPGAQHILLAIVETDGSSIRFIHSAKSPILHPSLNLHEYLLNTRKFALKSGVGVAQGSGIRKLSVGAGEYWRAMHIIAVAGGADVAFSYFYGAGGATEVAAVSQLDITDYDLTGTLTTMTAGYFRTDSVMITSDNRVSVIYGTQEFATQPDAEAEVFATIPAFILESGLKLAKVIVEQGVGIASIIDVRPDPNASTGSGGSGGGVTAHSLLTGLGNDDHTIYMLASGARAMTGVLNMGGNAITNPGLIDGVDITAHAARHLPGGADALTLGTGPATIGTANDAGTDNFFGRNDHVHDHGAQTEETHHAVATQTGAGFMSGADKIIVDGVVNNVVSAYFQANSASPSTRGHHVAIAIGTNGAINLEAFIPSDAVTIVGINAIGVPAFAPGATLNIDLLSDYGNIAAGEAFNEHTGSDLSSTFDLTGTQNNLTRISLLTVFTLAAAGDALGVELDHNAIGGTMDYLGIEVLYTRS